MKGTIERLWNVIFVLLSLCIIVGFTIGFYILGVDNHEDYKVTCYHSTKLDRPLISFFTGGEYMSSSYVDEKTFNKCFIYLTEQETTDVINRVGIAYLDKDIYSKYYYQGFGLFGYEKYTYFKSNIKFNYVVEEYKPVFIPLLYSLLGLITSIITILIIRKTVNYIFKGESFFK